MIARYTTPDMAEVWSDQRRYAIMLEIELSACEAMEARGEVPAGTALQCHRGAKALWPDRFPLARIHELERTVKHDVIAFLTAVGEVIGEPARHLHKGMTSSDVLDTALAVQLRDAGWLLLREMDQVLAQLRARAEEHRHTLCMGRSHGMHAEPTTFGLKLALAWDELRRGRARLDSAIRGVAVGKVSGAVGTFAHVDPAVEARVCAALGLGVAPVSSQIVPRDVHAHYFHCLALLATSVERLAVELRHLQRTEVGEVAEPFTPGQKGSSAMPHKQNPVLSENLSGLARLVRAYAQAAMDDVVLWHERDISHSSVERVIGPDATIALLFMLRRLAGVLEGLVVFPERMLRNLEATGGQFHAQRVLLALVEAGLSREQAYELVQRHALAAAQAGDRLMGALASDPEVAVHLPPDRLAELADPGWYVRRVDLVLERVFAQGG
jgi:adenylosuccinate lyase